MSAPPTDSAPLPASLLAVRLGAAFGAVVAIALVVFAFTISIWLGAVALFVSPVVPMGFVLAIEAIRR